MASSGDTAVDRQPHQLDRGLHSELLAHVRRYEQKLVDGNPTDAQECADPALLCFGDDATPANGAGGVQLANPFAPGTILGEIDRSTIRSTSFGVSGQATNTDQLFGHGPTLQRAAWRPHMRQS